MYSKSLLLTFDYELFLGRKSGTVNKCLIKPTNKLLKILENNNIINAIFFVDTIYLLKIRELSECKADYDKIISQLISILQNGHYIFPHLHPHWLNAKYDKIVKQWDLSDNSLYRFHKININKKEECFKNSIELIQHVQILANIYYPIDAYRAGGFCLQPFSDFKPFFDKFNIQYDFSVLKGFENKSINTQYNYLNTPNKPVYTFNNDITEECHYGEYIEFSISNIINKSNLYTRLVDKFLWVTKNRSLGDGLSIDSGQIEYKNTKKIMASFDLIKIYNLSYFKKYLQKNDYLQFVSHPKMLSLHNLKMLSKFLKFAQNNFILITDYKQMAVKYISKKSLVNAL